MPLKVTFELSDKDLRFFAEKASAIAERSANKSEAELIRAAEELVETMSAEDTPAFVTDRVEKLQQMVTMLKDEMWQLDGKDREQVIKAIAYFADPEDMIADDIPTLGLIDDAVMIELVVRSLRHELEAYDDFCKVQRSKRKSVKGPVDRETWLALRRTQLKERMRRRRRREREPSAAMPRLFRMF